MSVSDLMSVFDIAAEDKEAYIILRFVNAARGRCAEELADDIGWPLLKTRRFLDKLREIMRRQVANDPVTPTAKTRFRELEYTYHVYADDNVGLWLLLAEAMWRDKWRRVPNGYQFKLLHDALRGVA